MNAADRAALATAADILGRLPDVLLDECERRGIKQYVAAEQIGVDRQTVSRWLNGRTRPGADDVALVLAWLAKAPR